MADGLADNPAPERVKGKRGRPKSTPERNMLTRLRDYKEETLRFAHDFRVAFDNNLAERDLRMSKTYQKVSGGFRSLAGAQEWARLRSYISTARKHGRNVLGAIADAIAGRPFVPART